MFLHYIEFVYGFPTNLFFKPMFFSVEYNIFLLLTYGKYIMPSRSNNGISRIRPKGFICSIERRNKEETFTYYMAFL